MTTDWNEARLVREYASRDRAITDWRLGYSEVLKLLGKVGGKQVLDYGCGSGKFARRLADLGAVVCAVDTSEEAIRKATERPTGGIDYQRIKSADLSSIEQVDAAVINFVLCCVQDRKEIVKILSSISRKLEVGGPIVICEPHPEGVGHKFVSYSSKANGKLRPGSRINVKLTGLSKKFCDFWRPTKEYVDLIHRSGFLVERIAEPLANPEELFWQDEKIQAPYLIIKAIRGEQP